MPDPTWVPDRRDFASPTGLSPALVPFSKGLRLALDLIPRLRPHDPGRCPARFGLVPVRSPLLRESRLISFPPGTEMFQFPGSPRAFRDRRSLGSSPGLFAAFHARILMTPRHPPRALRSLTTPIRPPPRPRSDAAADRGGVTSPDLSGRGRGVSRRGGRRRLQGNDPHVRAVPTSRRGRRARYPVRVHCSWRYFGIVPRTTRRSPWLSLRV